MSKLSPLGQSMASLFTPESERIRAGQSKDAQGPSPKPGAMRVPGSKEIKSDKSRDSLGNGTTPGYEFFGKKKQGAEGAKEEEAKASPAGTVIEPPQEGPNLIRLTVGWEKILIAQKKLCEKAKNIFTMLDAPERYRTQRQAKMLNRKSRGCIVDVDIQAVQDAKAAAAKAKTEKEIA